MFRYERPQKGRYRQFHQFGVEALGFAGPDVDAEQIVHARAPVGRRSGSTGVQLQMNSLGDAEDRARAPRRADRAISRSTRDGSTRTRSGRLHSNPLRILDTQEPARCRR